MKKKLMNFSDIMLKQIQLSKECTQENYCSLTPFK